MGVSWKFHGYFIGVSRVFHVSCVVLTMCQGYFKVFQWYIWGLGAKGAFLIGVLVSQVFHEFFGKI